jgi:cold shock CspA family protein
MLYGRVVWFESRRGFGAIRPDDVDADVSVR